jgi:hypothetical protein
LTSIHFAQQILIYEQDYRLNVRLSSLLLTSFQRLADCCKTPVRLTSDFV